MPFGIDDAIMIALMAASTAGAIGGGQRKQISPEWLKAHFGAAAVNQETLDLFNNLINSPRGQQLVNSAAEAGQRFSTDVNANAAAAGLTPMGGGGSGTGVFATSAGDQASNRMVSDVQGNLMSAILPIAQQMVSDRMNAHLGIAQQGGLPGQNSAIWQNIGNAAGTGLAFMNKKPTVATTATTATTTPQPNMFSPTPMSPIQPMSMNKPNGFSTLYASSQRRPVFRNRISRFTGNNNYA